MHRYLLSFVFLSLMPRAYAQSELTQVVRGTVVDAESQFPLIGVNVSVRLPNETLLGTSTDVDGVFRLEAVPLGRQTVSGAMSPSTAPTPLICSSPGNGPSATVRH